MVLPDVKGTRYKNNMKGHLQARLMTGNRKKNLKLSSLSLKTVLKHANGINTDLQKKLLKSLKGILAIRSTQSSREILY